MGAAGNNWSIRRANPEDAEAISKMAAALNAYEGKPPLAFTAEDFRRDGFGPTAAFTTLIAERDGAAMGYVLFYPGYDVESAARGIHLADLYVKESARHQGIGRALLAAVVRECRDIRGTWVAWFVEKGNVEGQWFYQRIGAAVDTGTPFWTDVRKLERALQNR
jgi:GNAT superfamily N-acetyltransferase